MTTSLPAPLYVATGLQHSVFLKLVILILTQVLRYKSSGILHSVDRLKVTEVTKERISSIFQGHIVLEECSTLTAKAIHSP